jgi:hypothetical protein
MTRRGLILGAAAVGGLGALPPAFGDGAMRPLSASDPGRTR